MKAGLVDTVALLAWTAASLEDGDKHSLATSVMPLDKKLCYVFDKKSFIDSFTFRPWRQRKF